MAYADQVETLTYKVSGHEDCKILNEGKLRLHNLLYASEPEHKIISAKFSLYRYDLSLDFNRGRYRRTVNFQLGPGWARQNLARRPSVRARVARRFSAPGPMSTPVQHVSDHKNK